MTTAAKRKCIVVLGMHGSGTSAVARVLGLLGASLPAKLQPLPADNALDAPRPLVAAHEALLAEAGSSWDDWRPFDSSAIPERRKAHFVKRQAALLRSEFGTAPVLVLADPRISRFVPVYDAVFDAIGSSPVYLLVNRHPRDVVASLVGKHGFTKAFAAMLWLQHVLTAEAATRKKPRVFVGYEDLLANWRGVALRAGGALNLDLASGIDGSGAKVDALLLRYARQGTQSTDDAGEAAGASDRVNQAYQALLALAENAQDQRAMETMDALRAELETLGQEERDAVHAELAARAAAKLALQREAATRLTKATKGLARVERSHEVALRQAAENSAKQLADSRGEVASLRKQQEALQKEKADLQNKLNASALEASAAHANANALARERDLLAGELQELRRSPSWRATRPLRELIRFKRRAEKAVSGGNRQPPSQALPLAISAPAQQISARRETRSEGEARDLALIEASEYFDADWYVATYGATLGDETNPARHYLRTGFAVGHDPSRAFSTAGYLAAYGDVRAARANPLLHYIKHGAREGRSPAPKKSDTVRLFRFTPEETGRPYHLLAFDAYQRVSPRQPDGEIVVHLHLDRLDLAADMASYLQNILWAYRLLVSVPAGQDCTVWHQFFAARLPEAAEVIVRETPPVGRDVQPWAVLFRDQIRRSDLLCNINTKTPEDGRFQAGWREFMLHSLLGSPAIVGQILDLFGQSAETGIVAPRYFWSLAGQPSYGRNAKTCRTLYDRLGGDAHGFPEACPHYPAGGSFWIRTETLKPLLDLDLDLSDFGEDTGQIDGTMAHAVERALGLLPGLAGQTLQMVTADVPFDLRKFIYPKRPAYSRAIKRITPVKEAKARADVLFYTCLSGAYEAPMPLLSPDNPARCVVFTDNVDSPAVPGADLRLTNYIHPQPVRTARFVKTHPHVWFPDAEYACWIDSNVHFMGSIDRYVARLEETGADCGFIVHPVRSNFVDEAKVLLASRTIDPKLTESQINRYLSHGLIDIPLIESNFFICRPRSERVAKFFGMWWSEINKYTHRDQLSLAYAMKKSGLVWTNLLDIGQSTRTHADFIHFAHGFPERDAVINWFHNGRDDDLEI